MSARQDELQELRTETCEIYFPSVRRTLEVIEDRSQLRSTIVTSQIPVALWHEALGEPTVADAILDRLLHGSHRIELRGESLRKRQMEDPTPTVTKRRLETAITPARRSPHARQR